MVSKWFVHCPHCRKTATEALPPKAKGFVNEVHCSLCNQVIDAKNGSFVSLRIPIVREEVDLLEVF